MIRQLTEILADEFGLENPQLEVEEIKTAELNSKVMAYRLIASIERGYHYRRAAYSILRRVMDAGARGCEIIIKGKLSSQRGRQESFRQGFVAKSGKPAETFVDTAVANVTLKPGELGVHVRIMQPGKTLPDEIKILAPEITPEEIAEEVTEEVTEEIAEEVTEEIAEEATEEIAEEATEEATEEVTEEETEEATEEIAEEATEEATEEETEEATEEIAEEATEEVTEEATEEVTEEIAEEVSLDHDNQKVVEGKIDEVPSNGEIQEETDSGKNNVSADEPIKDD